MNTSYKKLLFKLIIITILILKANYNLANSSKVNSGYFYSRSYEGTAGYCAVITPELSQVSNDMTKKLNILNTINNTNQSSNTIYYDTKPQKINHNNHSFTQIALETNITPKKIKQKTNPFQQLPNYIVSQK